MFEVKPEETADCADVAQLHVAAHRIGYAGILPDQLLAELDPSAWARQRRVRLADPAWPLRSLVATDERGILGFVGFGPYRYDRPAPGSNEPPPTDPDVGEIAAIYVHPDHWGTGVSDLLMQAGLKELPQAEIRLHVFAANARALRFYARHGFGPDGFTKSFHPRGWEHLAIPEVRLALHR